MLCIFTALMSLSIGDTSKLSTIPCNLTPTRNSIPKQYLYPTPPCTFSLPSLLVPPPSQKVLERMRDLIAAIYVQFAFPPPRHFTCVETPFPYTRTCPLLWLSKNVGIFIKELIRAIQQTLPWYSKETLAWILHSGCAKFKIWSKFRYFFYNSGDLYWPKSHGVINRSGEQVRHKRDLGTTKTHKVPNNYVSPVRNVKYKHDKHLKEY